MTRKRASKQRAKKRGPQARRTRVTLVDQAYEEIRRRVLDNEYQPAQQVLELELADALGMSRTPVREALVRLQNEGFVQLVPRHGMRVVPLSLSALRDMYEVLTALELAAVERLVRQKPDDGVLAPLDDALDAMDKALKKGDFDGWVKADERFHRKLIELSGNERLATMTFSVSEQAHRARMATVRLRTSLELSNEEHRALVNAIRRGDVTVARTEHWKHRARASDEIIKLLERTRLGSF